MVKHYALTKINSPRPRMRYICSSAKYAAGDWKIHCLFVRASQLWQSGG